MPPATNTQQPEERKKEDESTQVMSACGYNMKEELREQLEYEDKHYWAEKNLFTSIGQKKMPEKLQSSTIRGFVLRTDSNMFTKLVELTGAFAKASKATGEEKQKYWLISGAKREVRAYNPVQEEGSGKFLTPRQESDEEDVDLFEEIVSVMTEQLMGRRRNTFADFATWNTGLCQMRINYQ